jgi:hypothetical protein
MTSTTDSTAPADTSAQAVFTPEQSAQLLAALGLPADTTDAELILATVADLVAQATDPADPAPSAVAAAAARVGLDVVDADTLAALRHDAAEGRRIKAAAEAQRIEASVDDAIRKGKITLSRRRHWVDLISADPGMADVLAGVPDETAVPLTEIGHGVDSENGPQTQRQDWFY